MEGSGQAILVDPSPVNFIDVPAISDAPKKRLQDPFPAILPASGKESVARTPLTPPLPASSSNTHSLPTRLKVSAFAAAWAAAAVAATGAAAVAGLCSETQDRSNAKSERMLTRTDFFIPHLTESDLH